MQYPAFFRQIIVMLVFFVSLPINAQDEQQTAKDLFNTGRKAFENKQYIEAAKAFRTAYDLMPSWKLHYNIAQAEAAGKRYGLALESLEKYLAEGGDDVPDDRKEEVIAEITRLRVTVGTLEIDAPEGAEITVDGVVRGAAPLSGRVKVSATVGTPVSASINGQIIFNRTVSVGGGENLIVIIKSPSAAELSAAAPTRPDDTSSATQPPAPERKDPLRPVGWALLGTGLAVTAAGVVTGAMAISTNKDLQDCAKPGNDCNADTSSLNDRQDTLSVMSTVFVIGGGAIAATGLSLLIVSKVKKDRKTDTDVTIMPAGSGNALGAVITGRF